jgi:GT2 family glycosyltransferase
MVRDLSISIINTDNRDQILDCLRSVYANTHHISLEVIVVDNASTDGSVEAIATEFPEVKLIRNKVRRGFSTNNNLALSQATGRYLMLLNDDTIVQPGAFDRMIEFMHIHSIVGAAGPQLLNPDGSIQQSIGFIPHPLFEAFRPVSSFLRPLNWRPVVPVPVDVISGACLLVRREVVDQVGLLDANFDPLYSEEIDWCYRIRETNWQIYYLPQAQVIHLGSQTMNRVPLHKTERLLEKKALFFRKHYGRGATWLYKLGLLASSLTKVFLWALLVLPKGETAKQKVAVHWYISRRALRF